LQNAWLAEEIRKSILRTKDNLHGTLTIPWRDFRRVFLKNRIGEIVESIMYKK
jgi:hypothetical protein